jgi:hypothetical protein
MKITFVIDKELKKNQKQTISKTGVRDIMTRRDFYNMSQIAEATKWSINIIKQEMDSGNLESRKVGTRRYSTQEQIDKWIEKI